jgi:hypothetical protein
LLSQDSVGGPHGRSPPTLGDSACVITRPHALAAGSSPALPGERHGGGWRSTSRLPCRRKTSSQNSPASGARVTNRATTLADTRWSPAGALPRRAMASAVSPARPSRARSHGLLRPLPTPVRSTPPEALYARSCSLSSSVGDLLISFVEAWVASGTVPLATQPRRPPWPRRPPIRLVNLFNDVTHLGNTVGTRVSSFQEWSRFSPPG